MNVNDPFDVTVARCAHDPESSASPGSLSLLVRPRLCRCTVLGALPQSSGQSAGLIPASVLPRAHLLLAFKPLLGLSATAAHDLVNVVHLWNIDSLLSHPQPRLDCCCQQRRSDRLLLCSSDVSEVRLVLASRVPHGGMRDLVLHCLTIKLLIWTLFAAEASGCFCRVLVLAFRAGSALFSPAVGPLLSLWCSSKLLGLLVVFDCKRYEESASGSVSRKDMDALFRKVKQLLSEGRRERNEGVNPEEVVEDDAMDWEWDNGNEPSVDEQMRNLRKKMAEMSLLVERLERNMPLGCEESGSSSGGGEWAW